MDETARSIDEWQCKTFNTGQVKLKNVVKKLLEEIRELHAALDQDDSDQIAMEAIDVSIVALAIPRSLGFNPQELLNLKMAVNRERKWAPVVDGVHQHVTGDPKPRSHTELHAATEDRSKMDSSGFQHTDFPCACGTNQKISPEKIQEMRRAGLSVQKYLPHADREA